MAEMLRRPIELDLGFGLGTFALAAAAENLRSLILGVDINSDSLAKAEAKRQSLGLENVQFIHAEALQFLTQEVPDCCVSAVHIYFPTPYYGEIRKKNVLGDGIDHWLVSPALLRQLKRVAVSGASLRLVTDHPKYFRNAVQLADRFGMEEIPWVSPLRQQSFGIVVGTGCEIKTRKEGREIYKMQRIIR